MFVSSVFAFVCVFCCSSVLILIFVSFVSIPALRQCPLLATFLSVVFCLLSLLFFSGRIPGLIWFGSVYLVTRAGFVADQLM